MIVSKDRYVSMDLIVPIEACSLLGSETIGNDSSGTAEQF